MSNRLQSLACLFAACLFFSACAGDNTASDASDTRLIQNPASDKPITAADSARLPIIAFDTLHYDFGNIAEGEVPVYEFKFTNKGKSNLLISNVQATCGCTTPYFPKDIIRPGGSEVIKVSYDSKGRPGTFRKGVIVTANTYPSDTRLNISGNVIPKS